MDLEPLRTHSHEQVRMYVDAKTFYKELNVINKLLKELEWEMKHNA